MKKLISLLLLLSFCSIYAQSSIFKEKYKKFNKLICYTPKPYNSKEKINQIPEGWNPEINTIYSLRLASIIIKTGRLSKTNIHLLEEKVNDLAISFYLENKPILIDYYGGYSDCIKSSFNTTTCNNKQIIILRFCHTCTDRNDEFSQLIAVFNNRITALISKN